MVISDMKCRAYSAVCAFVMIWMCSCSTGMGNTSKFPSSSPSTITSVNVDCVPVSIEFGQTTHCTAAVQGTGNYNTSVTWATSGGTISATGLFTAPTAAGPVTITATSVQDANKSGSATVTVTAGSTITSVSASCLPA